MTLRLSVGAAMVLLLSAGFVFALGRDTPARADSGPLCTFKVDQARTGYLPDGPRNWNGLRYSGMRATPVLVDGKIFMGG